MKLYAQHGHQPIDRLDWGIIQHLIDGIVFSPRDIQFDKLTTKLDDYTHLHPTERFFDPQYYSCFQASSAQARLGYLTEDGYNAYFQPRRRIQLESESLVKDDLELVMGFQRDLKLTGIIAPNIFIPKSFDSIEALVAKNFIRNTAGVYAKLGDDRPVYATLAVSRDAFRQRDEFLSFMNDITLLPQRPTGFYVLIGARSDEARDDIYDESVIASWMFINYSLVLNGYQIINGFSDLMTPFLGITGAAAGCSGWWSYLRAFSTDTFGPRTRGGGNASTMPTRYLSAKLLNRITSLELDQLRKQMPDLVNGLPTDVYYDTDNGSIPERNKEVLQSWESIKHLDNIVYDSDIGTGLSKCLKAIAEASELYDAIPIRLSPKSNSDHLEPLAEGLKLFSQLAEIEIPAY